MENEVFFLLCHSKLHLLVNVKYLICLRLVFFLFFPLLMYDSSSAASALNSASLEYFGFK